MAVMHILLTTKLKLKAKWYLVYGLVFLLAIKLRINRRFEIELEFLIEEILSLISLSSVIKTGQA